MWEKGKENNFCYNYKGKEDRDVIKNKDKRENVAVSQNKDNLKMYVDVRILIRS